MSSIIPSVPRNERAADAAHGVYFDGISAAAQDVTLTVQRAAGVLEIRGPGVKVDWPLHEVRQVPDQAGLKGLVLRRTGESTARLFTGDRALAASFSRLRRRAVDAPRGRLARWAGAAIASVALIVFVLVPIMANQLAVYIPVKGEKALGDATLGQIREALDETGLAPTAICTKVAGRRAMRQMQSRLSDQTDLPIPLTVTVLDHPMANAFALPGGHIVVMRGLIDKAANPEEVAAVFAHEMGHVVSRDPTRNALRSAGSIGVLGLMFGDFAGGALVLFLAERLIDAQYSQGAEAAADVFAHDLLLRAQIAPAALGTMFERLVEDGQEPSGIVAHFQSHPEMVERIRAAQAATPEGFEARPIMTTSQWAALRNICGK